MWPRPPLAWDIATFGMLGRAHGRWLGTAHVLDHYPPLLLDDHRDRLGIGWDDHLYVVEPCNNLVLLYRIARDGRIVYGVELPHGFDVRFPPRADRQGRVVLAHRTTVLRVSADGSEVQTLVERSASDPGIEGMAVGPGGEVTLAIESEDGGLMRVAEDASGDRRQTKPLLDRRRIAVPVLAALLALGIARVAAVMFLLVPGLERIRQSGGELEGYATAAAQVPRVDAEGAAHWLDLIPWVQTLEGVATLLLVLALVVSTRHPRQAVLQALPPTLITQPIVRVLVPVVGLDLFSLYNFYLTTQILAFVPPFLWAAGFIRVNQSPTKSG